MAAHGLILNERRFYFRQNRLQLIRRRRPGIRVFCFSNLLRPDSLLFGIVRFFKGLLADIERFTGDSEFIDTGLVINDSAFPAGVNACGVNNAVLDK